MRDCVRHYRFIRELGRGQFGCVFRVEYIRGKREVALTIVDSKDGDSDDMTALTEVRFLQDLKEVSGVPPLMDYFIIKKQHYIVTPLYLDSLENLQTRNSSNRFLPKTLARIAVDLLAIIRDCHRLGVAHRDIKPDNLMIGPTFNENRLFLIDFGLAHRFATVNGMNLRGLKEDYEFKNMNHATPSMMHGYMATPVDDLLQFTYTLAYLCGLNPFNNPQHSQRLKQKINFQKNPSKFFVFQDAFLVSTVEKICRIPENADFIDYDDLISTLKVSSDPTIDYDGSYTFHSVKGVFYLF